MSTYPTPPPAPSQLVVNTRKPFGAWGVSPKITIDGYPAPARWERNAYPIVPGRHEVRVSVNYLWEFGAASQLVDIAPGQSVELFYSPPMITLVGGRMGFEPQPRPGTVGFWLIMAIPILLVVAVVVGIVGSALGG